MWAAAAVGSGLIYVRAWQFDGEAVSSDGGLGLVLEAAGCVESSGTAAHQGLTL